MKLTRRTFMIAGAWGFGGLLLGAAGIGAYMNAFDRKALQEEALADASFKMMAQWILLAADGTLRVLVPHTEMGQGAQTSLLQIALDELDADPERTILELAPAHPAFTHSDVMAGFLLGETEMSGWTKGFVERALGRACQLGRIQFTGGSTAVRFSGWRGLRRAAAAAREMLAQAGADALGVARSEVETELGAVHHRASGRQLGYGELAAAAAALPLPEDAPFKDPARWQYIGTRYPRIDLPEKVFGTAAYGIDRAVPGMRFASVAQVPLAQGRVTGVRNRAELEAMPGVEAVIALEDVVAVVADNPWRAEQAARRADIDSEAPESGPVDPEAWAETRQQRIENGPVDEVLSRGEDAVGLSGENVIEAVYTVPFLAHVPMEPLNATVWEEEGKVHLATGVQGPLAARTHAAEILGRDFEDVLLHSHTMGGGFGRRNGLAGASLNWVRQACEIHNAVKGAVKLTWSREVGIGLSTYRPADTAHYRAKLGADGLPTHWQARSFTSIGLPTELVPPYNIPNILIEGAQEDPPLPFGYWRSVDASSHCFFMESFVDELARAAGQDPLAYRLAMSEPDGRMHRVLTRAGEMADYGRARQGRVLGVAAAHCFGSYVAEIVEVSLEGDRPRVHNVWCAVDCGLSVNPGSVEAQMQGGIHFGLSAALYGRIDFREGRVVQGNFHDYQVVRFQEAPRVEVVQLTTPDAPMGGAGEVSTPPIAPAVANALAQLGERPRHLPFQA